MNISLNPKKFRAFTLIEIMVVVVILGILAATIIPQIAGTTEEAKVGAAKSNIPELESALERYYVHMDRYPTTEEGLKALTEAPSWLRLKMARTLHKIVASRPLGTSLSIQKSRNTQILGVRHLVSGRRRRGWWRRDQRRHRQLELMTPPSVKQTPGFTLIELMVVIVIISIMSAVIVGEMGGTFHDALLRSTARHLISVLSLASSRAISQDRMRLVRFDAATGRYALETRRHGEFSPDESSSENQGKIDPHIAVRFLGEGFSDSVSFYPDGTADEREIELRDPEGFGVALRVNPITSRIQLIELKRQ